MKREREAPKSSQEALKQMGNLSWDQPCLSTYSYGFSGSKRGCGRKPSFHVVESHQAGAPLQAWGSSRPWTCPDLTSQLLVPRRMSIPDFRLPEEVMLTPSTRVLLRILLVDVQRVSAWGCGAVNSRRAGDHSTLQAAGAEWVGFFHLLSFLTSLPSSNGARSFNHSMVGCWGHGRGGELGRTKRPR